MVDFYAAQWPNFTPALTPLSLHLLKSQIHGFGRFIGVFVFSGFQAFRDEAHTASNLEAGLPIALFRSNFRIGTAENDDISVI